MQQTNRDNDPYRLHLEIVDGPHASQKFVFDHYDVFVAGRSKEAHLRLNEDPHFSRFHFRLEINPPLCRLVDLQSTNGTFLNGERIEDALLKDGDEIRAGETALRVSISGPPATDEWSPNAATVITTPVEIPDYEVRRELGRGSMGVVYHAVQRSTGREVALKLIRPAQLPDAEAMQLFVREASLLSQLRHRHIVESIEFGLHQRQMYISMEYIDAVDLELILKEQSRKSQIRIVCGVMCYVLEALQHAHEQDIVHRDVKPRNILVFHKGRKVSAKLSDFGLAKNYVNAGFSDISPDNDVRGTLAYMAPEQLVNCRFAKPACDIYGAGACLYMLLTGRRPHESDSATRDAAAVLNSKPDPILDHAPDIPKDLAIIVDRALAWEPCDRFSSAEHMRKALLPFTHRDK